MRQEKTGAPVRLRVEVLPGKCCGYTLCNEVCPEMYHIDDQGFVRVPDPVVPAGLEERAREGAEICPEGALVLREEPVTAKA
jgi:ferredoxin